MSDAIWVAALLLLIWPGLIAWRLPIVARLDLPARLAFAFIFGVAIVVALLYTYSFAHVPWTRLTVGVPLLLFGVAGWRRIPSTSRCHPESRARSTPPRQARLRSGQAPRDGEGSQATKIAAEILRRASPAQDDTPNGTNKIVCPPPVWIILIFAAITLYGVATARETCADLIYFWGPKAQQFHHAGKIDAEFLAFPHYYLMHPDYPPLLPLLYQWPSLIAHRFSWWGALFVTPIALLAIAFAFNGLARSGWCAVLLTAILAYGFAIGMVAGAADPVLLLFEVTAIAALTFAGDRRDGQILAAVALGAAAFTKVEGSAFAILTLGAYMIVTRRAARTLLIAGPSIVLLGSWLAFAARHHLNDAYWNPSRKMHLETLGLVASRTLRQASYGVAWVPWFAAIAPLAITRWLRRAALPLLVAAGSIAATIFFYLHSDNPAWWIDSSAMRVLLTPLACLVVASAAGVVESPGDGVVPEGKETEGSDGETGRDPGRAVDQVRRVQGDRLSQGSGPEPQRLPEMRLPLPDRRAGEARASLR